MISVCIPTYNGQEFILQQIESILNQLNENDEIVVSDDNSTDNTIAILNSLNDVRIKIYYNEGKNGVIYNIENALKKCKGDFIFLSDQDDIWLENKVEVSLQALQKATLVVSDCHIANHKLEIIQNSFFETNKSHKNKWLALTRNPYIGCCMAFKKELLELALPFPKKLPMHDIWLGNVAAFYFNFSFIDNKLIFYRRHDKNASSSSEPTKTTLYTKISYRIPVLFALIGLLSQKIKIKLGLIKNKVK